MVDIADASHRLRRMSGRDPHEAHRAATPLELFFDLTFVVAFAAAGSQMAHALVEDHVGSGVVGLLLLGVRDLLGLDQLHLVRVGLRHRRLGLPPADDGPDGGRGHPGPGPAGGLRVGGRGQRAAQRRDGRRLRGDARADARLLGARGAAGPVPPAVRPGVHGHDPGEPGPVVPPGGPRPPDPDLLRGRRRPAADRAGGPGDRRVPLRGHPVAPAPHRRALRPADDHHPGRGADRHGRGDVGLRERPRGRVDRRRRRRAGRRHRADLRDVVVVLRDAVG